MKGCARTCLLWILWCIVAGGAFFYYLRRFGVIEPQLWWAAAGAGVCSVIAVSYILVIRTTGKERSMLLEAMVGTPPKDGEWVAVSGTIRAADPLRTPLTGVSAVAYEYDIYRVETRSSGRNSSSSKYSYYDGKALAASIITTRQGAVRLLAVPTLDMKMEEFGTPAVVANARQYVSETHFQTRLTPKDHRVGVEQESTDDDGIFRVDKRLETDHDVDVADCNLAERSVKQGVTNCAFGLFSPGRAGLIPHPNWAKQARLMRGDATTVAGQLRSRMIKYVFGFLIFGAIAFGIVKFYQSYALKENAALIVHFAPQNKAGAASAAPA